MVDDGRLPPRRRRVATRSALTSGGDDQAETLGTAADPPRSERVADPYLSAVADAPDERWRGAFRADSCSSRCWPSPSSAARRCASRWARRRLPIIGARERTAKPRKILVAVAWPYASGLRHIGHVAGFGVPSDTFARYHRLRGNDVLMVSGTDEHGTPVMVAADAAGESPRETADRFNEFIREDLRALGLSYDLFTRTTTRNHYRVTQDLFRTLYEKGYVARARDARRVLRLDGPHASRSVHRGHVPDLRLRQRARRPVRQLRQPARPDRPDRPAVEDRRHAARLPEDEASLPRSTGVQGAADGVDRGPSTVGGRTFGGSRSTS